MQCCFPQAAAGTWKKWDGKDFTEPALGGKDFELVEAKQELGSNPSVHWNTLLQLWVMVRSGIQMHDACTLCAL